MGAAILANRAPGLLLEAAGSAVIRGVLGACLPVSGFGISKRHPSNDCLATERVDVNQAKFCFVSSDACDVAGAAQSGFKFVLINFFGAARERLLREAKVTLESLLGVPALLAC